MAIKERAVIFPIFEECKSFTLDSFWRDKFTEFSCNQFPPGMRYDSTRKNLVLKIDGKKTEFVSVNDNNPAETFQSMMRILRGKYDMRSSRDLKVQKKTIEEAMKKHEVDLNCEFKNIKPRNLKDRLIMNYISSLKIKHKLTDFEFNYLISVVQLGFQFRSLSTNDVVYADGAVTDITGLVFDEKNRIFTTPKYTGTIPKSEKASSADKFYSNLKKFIHEDTNRAKKFS